jgi:hypothetical protein
MKSFALLRMTNGVVWITRDNSESFSTKNLMRSFANTQDDKSTGYY